MKISARWSAPLLLAAWIVPLAGCGDSTATPIVTGPTWSDANAPDPTAGTWKTYVLATPSAHRPAAPAVQGTAAFNTDLAQAKGYVAERNASVNNLITYWNGGASRRWNEYHRHIITLAKPNPVRASRNLALASVGMYDALVASYDAKYFYRRPHPGAYDSTITIFGAADHSPSYIDEQIAMGRTACDVLANLYPAYADSFVALFNAQYLAELHNGNHFPSDIAAASGLGGQIAQDVLTRAAGDNSGAVNHGTAPVGPGYWVPTPPAFVQSPVEPAAGLWATWVVPTGSSLRPTPPPAFGSSEFTAETREVYDVGKSLTDDRRQIALFWADGGGTATPPGHWNQIAVDMGVAKGLNEPRMARMLALLGIAQADAFISCWDCKYQYWCVRPVTRIRADIDSTWTSLIATPPFPSFPSGHSTTSGAASTLLGYLFPEDAVTLRQMATDAMNSRLYGGIHYTVDNQTGYNLGAAIGSRVALLASRDGSPNRPAHLPVAARLMGSQGARVIPAGARLEDAAD